MPFIVVEAQDNQLVNSNTGEIFFKQTVCIQECSEEGREGDCLSIKPGRKLWFNCPASQFKLEQKIPVTWEMLNKDYEITPVVTNNGRTIMKIDLQG